MGWNRGRAARCDGAELYLQLSGSSFTRHSSGDSSVPWESAERSFSKQESRVPTAPQPCSRYLVVLVRMESRWQGPICASWGAASPGLEEEKKLQLHPDRAPIRPTAPAPTQQSPLAASRPNEHLRKAQPCGAPKHSVVPLSPCCVAVSLSPQLC